jgi:hypothetical protein
MKDATGGDAVIRLTQPAPNEDLLNAASELLVVSLAYASQPPGPATGSQPA